MINIFFHNPLKEFTESCLGLYMHTCTVFEQDDEGELLQESQTEKTRLVLGLVFVSVQILWYQT